MRKALLIILASLLCVGTVSAQTIAIGAEDTPSSDGEHLQKISAIRDDTPSADCDDGDICNVKSDSSGALYNNVQNVIPGTGATNLGKEEDSPHISGDTGVECLAVRTNSTTSWADTAGDYVPLSVGSKNALFTDINREYQSSESAGLLKAEDSVVSNGDAGAACLFRRNDGALETTDTDGDYVIPSTTSRGKVWSASDIQEDGGRGDGDPLSIAGIVRDDALTAGAEVSSELRYMPFRGDNLGALWTAGDQIEDGAASSGDRVKAMGVRRLDSLTGNAGNGVDVNGDYTFAISDNAGKLWTTNGGGSVTITTEVATDTAAYAAGDYINDADDITDIAAASIISGGSFTITDVVWADEGAEGKNVEVWFFHADPTNSTFTDNAAFTLHDTDLRYVACVVPVTSHFAAAASGVSTASINCEVNLATGTTLQAAIVAREAVTYDAVDACALTITLHRN